MTAESKAVLTAQVGQGANKQLPQPGQSLPLSELCCPWPSSKKKVKKCSMDSEGTRLCRGSTTAAAARIIPQESLTLINSVCHVLPEELPASGSPSVSILFGDAHSGINIKSWHCGIALNGCKWHLTLCAGQVGCESHRTHRGVGSVRALCTAREGFLCC